MCTRLSKLLKMMGGARKKVAEVLNNLFENDPEIKFGETWDDYNIRYTTSDDPASDLNDLILPIVAAVQATAVEMEMLYLESAAPPAATRTDRVQATHSPAAPAMRAPPPSHKESGGAKPPTSPSSLLILKGHLQNALIARMLADRP